MKIFITLLLTIIFFTSYCQEIKEQYNFSFGIELSPDYTSSRTFHYVEGLKFFPGFGYTLGVNFKYLLPDKWLIKSCLNLSKKSYEKREEKIYPIDIINSFPNPPTTTTKVIYDFALTTFEIPILLNYNLYNKNHTIIYLSGGLSYSRFIRRKAELIIKYFDGTSEEFKHEDYEIINPNIINIITGIGIQTKLFNNWKMHIEPIFSHSIRPIIFSKEYEYIYSFGVIMHIL